MIDVDQARHDIVRPALEFVGLWSQAAENLVLGTGLVESRLSYVRQIASVDSTGRRAGPRGPALGLFQMEPATHDDIWRNWLGGGSRALIAAAVRDHVGNGDRSAERLVWDLRYAAIMCRLHYRRVAEALPDYADLDGLSLYWKRHYNTSLGAGDPKTWVAMFRTYAM